MYLRDDIARLWADKDPLESAFALQGETFRDVPGRRTFRVELNGQAYFAKLHYGIGWREVIKNWLQLKAPVIGARNEYEVCRALAELNIPAPVPAAYASESGSMASVRSFVMCDELAGYTSLEDITLQWLEEPPEARLKLRTLDAVARFAAEFHRYGFIHRDFYICHLLAADQAWQQGQVQLAVLDLHRARRFDTVPDKWLKRDLAALLFSSLDLGYTRRDWLRFIRRYAGRPLRIELAQRGDFWQAVLRRAEKLYAEGLRKQIVQGRYVPSGMQNPDRQGSA